MVCATSFAHDIAVANSDGVTIYYNFTNNNTELAVTYQGSSSTDYSDEYSGNVVIPKTVTYNGNTYSVTGIGGAAFNGCSGLTSVTIPNSVTNIGNIAFQGCSGLTSITIPNSVTEEIGFNAFYKCTGLTTVKVENVSPTITSGNTFSNRANATLYVPAGSKEAYEKATHWKDFKEIVEYINFADENVKAICVQNWDTNGDGELSPDEAAAVTSLGTVFKNNEAITSFDELQYFTGLTSIGDYAFQNCSGLTSVTIGNSVTSIGSRVFQYCSSLTSVTIPNSVTSIGDQTFEGCSSLTSVTIGNSVTSIGQSAFYGCSGLTSVTIGNSVKTIGGSAFRNCSSLTSVTIPNSVTSIGSQAFRDCDVLSSVTIPNSVTSIGGSAFFSCDYLKSVTIPNSVTSIGNQAFQICNRLTSVKVSWENPLSISAIFAGSNTNATLYVPIGSKSAYQAADNWKEFKEIVEYAPVILLDETSVDVPPSYPVPMDVKVQRTIKGGEWSTICLPFAMTGEQVAEALGSVELADFSDYQVTKKGDKTISIMINFAPVDAADGMEANHPYLIRTSGDISDFTVTNVILAPDEENAQTAFTTEEDGQTVSKGYMKGIYHAQTVVPADNLFVSANKFYYSTGKTKMMAYRAYFYLADRLDRNESASAKISFMFNESSTNRIEDVEVRPAASSAIFDIQGRKVADSADGLQGLPKGIYIINGKKVVR